jgi:hypothetical protein
MLLDKIREVSDSYKRLNLCFTYENNSCKITIESSSNEVEEKFIIEENDDTAFEILKSLMPVNYIFDFYDEMIGENDLECEGYMLSNNTIRVFKGKVFSDCLHISEKQFNNDIDFYIDMFSRYKNISFGTKEIISNGIRTPLQIFIDHITSKNYKLLGFQYGGTDDNGYTFSYFNMQLDKDKSILFEYPQKDTFFRFNDSYLKFSDFTQDDIILFNSDFLKILKSIKEDNLVDYIKKHMRE